MTQSRKVAVAHGRLPVSTGAVAFFGALLSILLSPASAAALAPRDAVRNLPRITHTSTFDVQSESSPGTHTYTDNYKGKWEINWPLPAVRLGDQAQAKFDLFYQLELSDNLNRIEQTSADSRRDYWRVKLRLTASPELKAHFQFEQEDVNNARTPSTKPRTYKPTTTRRATVEWARPGYPSVSLSHSEKGIVELLGDKQTHGSSLATTTAISKYEHDSGRSYQRAAFTAEMIRSDNYLNDRSTSQDNLVVDASRQIELGPVGTLALGVNLKEYAKNDQSSIDYATNTASTYSLALNNGAVGGPLPVTYGFNYVVTQNDYAGQSGDQRVQRRLGLSYSPPVPEGKTASITAEQYYNDLSSPTVEQSNSHLKLVWGFSPNPRTRTSLTFMHEESTNLLTHVRTRDVENVTATFAYQVPGRQTSYTGTVNESIERDRLNDKRSINDRYNLRTSVELGPKTFLDLFYNQHYSGTSRGPTGLLTGSDKTVSGVNYRTKGNGINLDATWQQHLTRQTSGDKKDHESINVALSYGTPAGWTYKLILGTNQTAEPKSGSPLGYNYITKDRIQAIVIYTF